MPPGKGTTFAAASRRPLPKSRRRSRNTWPCCAKTMNGNASGRARKRWPERIERFRPNGSVPESRSDDTRIAAALATIEELRAGGARLVLVSHLGRPNGKRAADLSLAPVADRLRELTGAKVTLAPAVIGDEVTALAEELEEGDILVLENVRFEPGETSNDPELARALAALADL